MAEEVTLRDVLEKLYESSREVSPKDVEETVSELLTWEKRLRELATHLQTRNTNVACAYTPSEIKELAHDILRIFGESEDPRELTLDTSSLLQHLRAWEKELPELKQYVMKLLNVIDRVRDGYWAIDDLAWRTPACFTFCARGKCLTDPFENGWFEENLAAVREGAEEAREVLREISTVLHKAGKKVPEELESRVNQLLQRYERLIEGVGRAEELLRERAPRLRELVREAKRGWIPFSPIDQRRVRNDVYDAGNAVFWQREVIRSLFGEKGQDVLDRLVNLTYYVNEAIGARSNYLVGTSLLRFNDKQSFSNIREALDRLSELLGRRVGFIVPHSEWEGVSPAGYLNDLANAIHVTAEELMKRLAEVEPTEFEEVGRCRLVKGAPDWQKRFCEAWSRVYEERSDDYHLNDVEECMGYSRDPNRLYLRVGSSEGHATYVERKPGGRYFVRYFDTDEDVNHCLARLLQEAAACTCRVVTLAEGEEGVECDCPPDTIERIAQALARATSMDLRFRRNWTCDDESEVLEELFKLL